MVLLLRLMKNPKPENSMRLLDYTSIPVPPDHALCGGTFVTNTSGKDTEEITATVEAFGDPEIFMRGNVLHSTRNPFDLSDFWDAHRLRVSKPNAEVSDGGPLATESPAAQSRPSPQ